MFHKFKNQDERKELGGTSFIEFAYCKKKSKFNFFKKKEVLWNDDSLYIYVDDIEEFCKLYDEIINVKNIYGSNYYSKEQTKEIIILLKLKQPNDYLVLVEWLEDVKLYDGFWIYGI